MEKRIALIGIMVEDFESAPAVNGVLHQYIPYILGRMGLPKIKEHLGMISIVVEADHNTISALSGKLGMIPNVTTKTMYASKGDESVK